ncbi:dihydrofolate reductase family protein [Nonomuraea sp. NPDC050536]|uniref:dihydrofolate reductase family protein n=1 Tax=Nonomuraea sp. NPDC050536 TaxID=3364366 RepID=UPI0037CC972D
MRKLKLQVQVSADGYMSGPNGEMDWMTLPWDEECSAYVTGLWDGVGTIVLGRKLAEGFIPHWANGPADEPQEAIDTMNGTPKVVVSNSLTESPWDNTTVVGGDLTKAFTELKSQTGGDLLVYGGGTLVASLIAEGLIDELHLFVNPASTGGGLPVFPKGGTQRFDLAAARPFACGIVALQYEPKGS